MESNSSLFTTAFENVLKISPFGMFIVDNHKRIILWNEKAAEITGYSASEIIGRECFIFATKPCNEGCSLFNDKITKPIVAKECTITRKDGEMRIIRKNSSLIYDGQGVVIGGLEIFQDITDEKRISEELRVSNIELEIRSREIRFKEEQQRALLDNIPDMAWIKDRECRFLAANEAFARACGFATSELPGKNDTDIWPKQLSEAYRRDDEEVMSSSQAKRVVEPLADKQGAIQWIETIKTPIFDRKHRVIGTAGIARDITERKKSEDELLYKNALLEAQSETSIDGIMVISLDGRVLMYNQRFVQMWNIPPDILSTREDTKLLEFAIGQLKFPQRFTEKIRYLQEHKEEKSRDEIEFKDGRFFDHYSAPLIDATGKYHGRILYFRDITANKKAEERLAKINNSFLAFGRDPVENIQMLTKTCGELLGAACALYSRYENGSLYAVGQWQVPPGFSVKASAKGRICHSLITSGRDEVALLRNLPETKFAKDDPQIISSGFKTYFGKPVKCAGALVGTICAMYTKDRIPDAAEREVLELIASAIGIEEERRIAEEELHHKETRYRALVENMEDFVWQIDENAKFTYASPRTINLLGYAPDEMLGKTLFDFMPAGESERVQKAFNAYALVRQRVSMFENILKHKDGREILFETNSTPLISHGSFVGYIGVCREISGRKKMEEDKIRLQDELYQSQKLEALGRLAGGIAHDFNNLLTVIICSCKFLSDGLKSADPLRTEVDEIKKATDRAIKLTQQLLTYSRHQPIAYRILDINRIVEDMGAMLKRVITENVELEFKLAPGIAHIKSDKGQLEQILVNLSTNARDAMPNGGKITITTTSMCVETQLNDNGAIVPGGEYIMLTVADTGTGMNKQTLARIFEPFFTTKEHGKGTGLGLATVYGIVQQNGSKISVSSEPGKGTSVRIYFKAVHETMPAHEKGAPVLTLQLKGTETLFLVEDDALLREKIKRILLQYGYRVIEAADGPSALELIREYKDTIHLLVTDIIMPGNMNGRQLAEQVKPLHPEARVLFMSGYTEDVIIHQGIVDSSIDFLSKPFSMETLCERIRTILDRPRKNAHTQA